MLLTVLILLKSSWVGSLSVCY